jgi:hypothetical protein
MRGSMNEARVQTVPMAQLLLSRNAHFGKHRLCDMGCVSSSNRYMANAAAAGDEAGTGNRLSSMALGYDGARSPRPKCDALVLKLFGPADVSSYPTYPPLLGSELFDTDSESNTARS